MVNVERHRFVRATGFTLATFGVAFVMRPIGAVIFGLIGDSAVSTISSAKSDRLR